MLGDLRIPRCPECKKFTWIRAGFDMTAKCKNCGHKDTLGSFYTHDFTYFKLGLGGTAKLPGETA